MNTKLVVFVVLLVSVFLIGCTSSQSKYTAYNQPQGQQQGQYVGGGCGVASSADYEDTPIDALGSSDSAF